MGACDMAGRTALSHASEGGHAGIVQSLIQAGAVLNGRSWSNGRTALMYAADGSHKSVVELLVEAGADANVKDKD